MPTGNVPLLTAAKYGKDKTAPGVALTLVRESPILETLPFISFEGNALQKEVEGTLPSVEFRQVNGTYTASHGSNDMQFWGVAILGGEYKVDKFLTNVVANAKDIEAEQIMKLAKANAMRFDYEFINGTGASNGFKGVKQLITDGYGQQYDAAVGTLALADLDEMHALFRNTGTASAILASRRNQIRITTLCRNSAGGFSLLDTTKDAFDRQIWAWNGIPIRVTGDGINSSGTTTSVIADTELFMVKFSKDDVCGLLGMGGSLEVQRFGELQAAPQKMGRLEWYPGVGVFSRYSVVSAAGITA